jgi:hypothetical protein
VKVLTVGRCDGMYLDSFFADIKLGPKKRNNRARQAALTVRLRRRGLRN